MWLPDQSTRRWVFAPGTEVTARPSRSVFFCRHCHSSKTHTKCLRSKSGQRQSRKNICVFWWHCHSMKSLSRSTALVRTKMSKGGSAAVYICRSRVSVVMVSGLGNLAEFPESALFWRRGSGESGNRVVDEESPSMSSLVSALSSGDSSLMVARVSRSSRCVERTFCRIREGEKGVFLRGGGARNSSTVVRMAVVISALDVYGKQIFKTALYCMLDIVTVR